MTVSLTFTETYHGGRILLMLGQHQVGAIFPPSDDKKINAVWCWGFWLHSSPAQTWDSNHAKTELAAKNAILSKARDWLRKAGIE